MKVIILAGGLGTRLSEYTEVVPKPMVEIGGKPILLHIMKIYSNYGHKDFYIALGYKADVIINYFKKFQSIDLNLSENIDGKLIQSFHIDKFGWNIHLVFTGQNTMTGSRIKRLKKFINNETFMLTYGDGVANINLNNLEAFHKTHGKIVTVSAVRPPARFGVIDIDGDKVVSFREKSQVDVGWINGGFFVMESEFFDYIKDGDNIYLEREPLEKMATSGNLRAYKHKGF